MATSDIPAGPAPDVTVVLLNCNASAWMQRCLESLAAQTDRDRMEVIVADAASTDDSMEVAARHLEGVPRARLLPHGRNTGFGLGCNLGANAGTGRYIFFLNPDLWLEPDCIQRLRETAERTGAAAVSAYVCEYEDDTFQNAGVRVFDLFGMDLASEPDYDGPLFGSCAFFFVRREVFERLGQFDPEFFLYGEESDLSRRILIAGGDIVLERRARIHHRGAGSTDAQGTRQVTLRTSGDKRFYANRNHLLMLLKTGRGLLLITAVNAALLFLAEAIAGAILSRRGAFFRRAFVDVIRDVWRLRGHVAAERRRIAALRRRGDLWMMRYLTWRLSRWHEVRRMRRMGLPRVS